MDKRRLKQRKIAKSYSFEEEVSSNEWELIKMSEQEEDLISRMHKLVGDRWGLIAGRIPGRKPEEIERFWLMKPSCEGRRMNARAFCSQVTYPE